MDSSEQVLYFICLPHFGRFFSHRDCLTPPPPHTHTHTHSQACQVSLSSMLLALRNLGISMAINKTQGPDNVLEFMSIILDSGKMEARLPLDKVERIQASLASFESRKSCTLKELQSLIGTLNFACKVVPPGRPFL